MIYICVIKYINEICSVRCMTDSSLVSSGRRVSGMITVPEFKKIKSLVVQKSQVQDLEEKANRGYEALKVFFETEKLACISEVAEGYENLRDSLFVLLKGCRSRCLPLLV